MRAAPIYLVISTCGIGGAEKRLVAVWLELARRGEPVRLVVPAETYRQLCRCSGYEALASFDPNIVVLEPDGQSYRAFVAALWRVRDQIPAQSMLHFPLAYAPFVATARSSRFIISWVSNRRPTWAGVRNLKLLAISWLGFWAAAKIDVLNPENRDYIRRLPAMKSKTFLTEGGSFVDFSVYQPTAKTHSICFLGRFEPDKGTLDFARSLPLLSKMLQRSGTAAPDVYFIGRGQDEQALRELLGGPEYQGMNVTVQFMANPESILGRAKAFVSLQRPSNYPSKALIEAMACGCLPIITDCGESRLMADERLARYISPEIDPEELAATAAEILQLPESEFQRRSAEIREDSRRKFSMDVQLRYYEKLYWGGPASMASCPAEETRL